MKNNSIRFTIIITIIILCLGLMTIIGFISQNNKKIETKQPENLIIPIDTLGVTSRGINIYLYKIDGCEYIGNINDYQQNELTHKGNCSNPVHNKANYKSFFKK